MRIAQMEANALNIPNEWSPLRRVVVGHGRSMGPRPNLASAFEPTSKWHLSKGTYPNQKAVAEQLDGLAATLEEHGVEVWRPQDLPDAEQIFARDVGLVIDDVFIRSRTIEERQHEWEGVSPLLEGITWQELPGGVQLEGGDTVVLDDAIVVGITRKDEWKDLQVARTSPSALPFLASLFPERDVIGIELAKHDTDPLKCALHLDCAYMPLGGGQAIMCPESFVEIEQLNLLKNKHSEIFEVSVEEAALLQTNLLHIAPDTLLIDPGFTRLAGVLKDAGYHLIPCPLDMVGRMGGLFRCTTLPLLRRD